jgi:hypothetical protein
LLCCCTALCLAIAATAKGTWECITKCSVCSNKSLGRYFHPAANRSHCYI